MTPHYVRPPHYPLPTGSRGDGIGHDRPFTRPPRQSTAPPGLWAPAPEVVAEKVHSSRKLAALSQQGNLARMAPCGTETAAKRHVRNGQPLCDTCTAGRESRKVKRSVPERAAA